MCPTLGQIKMGKGAAWGTQKGLTKGENWNSSWQPTESPSAWQGREQGIWGKEKALKDAQLHQGLAGLVISC